MRARRISLFAMMTMVAMLLVASVAHAEAKLSDLIDQLKNNDDARVRTQAALALGASGDDGAVKPLCDALGDSNASVKVAAAAALGKLGKSGGLSCLQTAQSKETSASVKAQIEKSIAALQGASAAPPPPGPNTKFYVALEIKNKTSRPAAEIEALVRAALQAKIIAKTGYAVAPKDETTAAGGTIVKSKKLKGFYLLATVEAPAYSGGDLTQIVRVSMFDYPNKALQGEFSPKFTQSDTPSKDPKSEDVLMKMCAESAVESFQKVVASL